MTVRMCSIKWMVRKRNGKSIAGGCGYTVTFEFFQM